MLLLAIVAALLLLIDTSTRWLQPARYWLAEATTTPIYWLTNIPARISELGDESAVGRAVLEGENEHLRTELLILKGRIAEDG